VTRDFGAITAYRRLRERRVTDPTATLAAEIWSRPFTIASSSWADPASKEKFADLQGQALQELRAATATLD
jgi:hypothetical protein